MRNIFAMLILLVSSTISAQTFDFSCEEIVITDCSLEGVISSDPTYRVSDSEFEVEFEEADEDGNKIIRLHVGDDYSFIFHYDSLLEQWSLDQGTIAWDYNYHNPILFKLNEYNCVTDATLPDMSDSRLLEVDVTDSRASFEHIAHVLYNLSSAFECDHPSNLLPTEDQARAILGNLNNTVYAGPEIPSGHRQSLSKVVERYTFTYAAIFDYTDHGQSTEANLGVDLDGNPNNNRSIKQIIRWNTYENACRRGHANLGLQYVLFEEITSDGN